MSNNELRKHKTADKIKWIVAFLLIFLLALAIVALNLKVFGVFDKLKDKISNKEVSGAIEALPQENGLQFDIHNSEPAKEAIQGVRGVALAAVASPMAEDPFTKTLTATVMPVDAPDKSCDWSVEWANKDNRVDEDVTDFVTVAPVSDGAQTAIVECIKPFGNDVIVLTVTTRVGGFSATCNIIFEGAVQSISLDVSSLKSEQSSAWNKKIYILEANSEYDLAITLDNKFHSVGAEVNFELEGNAFGAVLVDKTTYTGDYPNGVFSSQTVDTRVHNFTSISNGHGGYDYNASCDLLGTGVTLTFTEDNKLHIHCGNSPLSYNYLGTGRGGYAYSKFKSYQDDKVPYFSIKIKDANSGVFSEVEYCFELVSSVTGVELSSSTITF